MAKDVKVVIGSNYGDEGKGLLTRFFAHQAKNRNENPIVVFHNGTAQRGHTVDYSPTSRHVYHHFGSGTADGVPTFFADSFWVHPMEFVREWEELRRQGVTPVVYCDPNARVITPFDMLADQLTLAHIAKVTGEPEHGSCCYGTWCATDREPKAIYTIADFVRGDMRDFLLEESWKACLEQLVLRGVDIEKIPEYKQYFEPNGERKRGAIEHFKKDLNFFFKNVTPMPFGKIFQQHDAIIFENGQGLGLDKDVRNDWHTTSKTGLYNPVRLLEGKNFSAEVCYVTRSYLTRHGIGPLEEEARKNEINADMIDKTNVPNPFQGTLRYGYLADRDQAQRITEDWTLVENDKRFIKSMAITHCNEFPDLYQQAKYYSDNPFGVKERT